MIAEKVRHGPADICLVIGARPFRRSPDLTCACGRLVGRAMRLAPHHDRRREPEVTCRGCVDALTALMDACERAEDTHGIRRS